VAVNRSSDLALTPGDAGGPSPSSAKASPSLADADEVDWRDVDGEAYVIFTYDEEWPEQFGAAQRGVP
jgi:hypothetical protein